MIQEKYRRNHPGAEFFSLLGQMAEYLEVYQDIGMDGILAKISDVPPSEQPPRSLDEMRHILKNCQRCPLHQGRTHIVFGSGNTEADLVFIGDAPIEGDDALGEPFSGPAGELLTRIIQAIGLRREDVYLTNIVKCRPPNDRPPQSDEMTTCEFFLKQQLDIIQPRLICVLGTYAAQTLLKTTSPISGLRGHFYTYAGIKVMPTYAPAHLLEYPEDKRPVWEDMKMVQKTYHQSAQEFLKTE